jgi:hypothetical protein
MMGQHNQPDQDTRTNQTVDLDTVLRRYLADPTASWGLGTFGAVAEFHRTGDEPASIDTGATLQVVTARGALRIHSSQEIRACAYEQPGHASESWSHVLTLCLPAAQTTMHRRTVLTVLTRPGFGSPANDSTFSRKRRHISFRCDESPRAVCRLQFC